MVGGHDPRDRPLTHAGSRVGRDSGAERSLNRLRIAVAVAALAVVSLAASAYLHLASPPGRLAIAQTATHLATDGIDGELEVRGVTSAWLPTVRADAIVVRSASGEEVLTLRQVTVDVDILGSLLDLGFHASEAHVHDGRITIISAPGGGTRIERALNPPVGGGRSGPEGSEVARESPEAPSERRVLSIENVTWGRLDLDVAVGHDPLRFDVNRGRGRFWLREHGYFQGRFWSLGGQMHSTMTLVPDATFQGVALTVDPSAPPIVRFAGRAQIFQTDTTLAGHVPASDGDGVRLCVWIEDGLSLGSLAGVAAELGQAFTSALSFELYRSAPPEEPRCPEDGE